MSSLIDEMPGAKNLWKSFFELNQIPRPSRKEEKVRKHLIALAESLKLDWKADEAGNLVIYKPGTPGKENHPTVLIQNHTDMVCDQLIDVEFDFDNDSIEVLKNGDWLKAKGTTLGADNGIGCAAAMATLFEDNISHPPLELLFTVDEETGLHGALNLDSSMISAKKMLNLDTEEWGIIYVGCAGGQENEIEGELEQSNVPDGYEFFDLSISGLGGGHSGVDIHMQQANALKLLAELVFNAKKMNIGLVKFEGGRSHNIIPREAKATVCLDAQYLDEFQGIIKNKFTDWTEILPECDKNLKIDLAKNTKTFKNALFNKSLNKFSAIVLGLPHGVESYVKGDAVDLAQTSANLAKVHYLDGRIWALSSIRFFEEKHVDSLRIKYEVLASAHAIKYECNSGYPGWAPVFDGKLLQQLKSLYKDSFGIDPEVKAIHAGLECGIIKGKLGEMDIVSFGPTILGAHTPEERVQVSTVTKFWDLYTKFLNLL
jgi:dipeptidase D